MTLLRCASGSRMKVRRLAAATCAVGDRIGGIDDHVGLLVEAGRFAPRAAAQEIERRIVRDAEQPAFRIGDRPGAGKRLDRLHQRFLHARPRRR